MKNTLRHVGLPHNKDFNSLAEPYAVGGTVIDIPAAMTSGPQCLIKYKPNIRSPGMKGAPEELALLSVMKDGRMEK